MGLLLRLGPWVIVIVALVVGLFRSGVAVERSRWQTAERERLALEESIRRSDARLGNRLAELDLGRRAELRRHADRLTEELHRAEHPLVAIASPGDCAGAAAAGVPDAAERGGGAQPLGAADRPADAPATEALDRGHAGGADVRITAHAQRLWNTALAGADVAAGACHAAGAAEPACDADTGISIEQVWANHIANAASCAADRARFQRLIELIEARQQGAPTDLKDTP